MIPFSSVIFVILLCVFANGNQENSSEKLVICNFVPNSITRAGPTAFNLDDLNPNLCTHLIYNRGNIDRETHNIVFDHPELAIYDNGGYGLLNRTMELRDRNPHLKVLLRVCCIDELVWDNSTISNDVITSKFTKNVIRFMQLYGFDGLYMDRNIDRNKQHIMREVSLALREEFDKHGYILARFVYPLHFSGREGMKLTSDSAEPYHLLIVGSHWAIHENITGIFSSLPRLRRIISGYLEDGIPAEKLVVSIPAFAMSYILCERNDTGVSAEICGPGNEGATEAPAMLLQYFELMRKMNNASEGWVVERDNATGMLYGHSNSLLWTSYEDPVSVRAKAQYIIENNLAGAFIKSVDNDDFVGYNGGIKFPLTRAVHDNLRGN